MDYTSYRAEDFAADESFINYYLRHDVADVTFWARWISLHPEKIDEVMLAEQLLDRLYMRISDEEQETEQQRMLNHLRRNKNRPGKKAEVRMVEQTQKRKLPVLAWVALPLVALLTIVLIYTVRHPRPLQWQTYSNAPGKKATIVLDDGSQVILSANATLQYHHWEKGDSMRVLLQGEAFFEVSPNAKRVFLVKAGEVNVAVLGTGFNVKSDPQEQTQTVALVHGKVHVYTPHGDALLQPQQEALYTPQTGLLQVTTFDTETVAGWKDGIIKWQNASFEEVAATFKKRHNLTLVNNTGREPVAYTGRFDNARMETIIKSYCYTQRFTYTIHGNEVILQNQR